MSRHVPHDPRLTNNQNGTKQRNDDEDSVDWENN